MKIGNIELFSLFTQAAEFVKIWRIGGNLSVNIHIGNVTDRSRFWSEA